MRSRYPAILTLLLTSLFGSSVAIAQPPCTGAIPGYYSALSGGAAGFIAYALPWQASVVPALSPPYQQPYSGASTFLDPNVPPVTPGGGAQPLACAVCPSLFSRPIGADTMAVMYMCAGNLYTITTCNSVPSFNSTITITNTAGTVQYAWDDDGCGTVNGLSTVTFAPVVTQIYGIRVLVDPCTMLPANGGLLQISCSPVPAPPPNDDPCGAEVLSVTTACNFVPGSNAFATTSAGVPNPTGCPLAGGYTGPYGADVWYTMQVPASGNLSVQVNLNSASDLAMALYTAGSCTGPWTQVSCVADFSGFPAPFITQSGLTPGAWVFVRVWSESGQPNMGTFSICAYEPVPPPNDNPCGAVALPLIPGCSPSTYNTESATALQANVTTSPATPSCGTPLAGGDVWFSVVAPATGAMTVNTLPGTLTDMAMAMYTLTTGTPCGPATFTEVLCNDNSALGGTMPRITAGGLTPGATYYFRVWNKTTSFGTFQICAFENTPPANDNPCGAFPLTVNYGCLMNGYTTEYATQTITVPNASCGGTANNDVWFSAVVPPNGVLQFDTNDGLMTDAAMAVYTGPCTGPLTQVACATAGSANGAAMPYISATGLTPGSTVYVRVWRQAGSEGTFQLCARRTDPAPGNCNYTLNMSDAAGDGWNGSYVTVCVGTPAVCTNYTINSINGSITFGANLGQLVTVTYTAVGGFQTQISYTLTTPTGGLLYASGTSPTPGVPYFFNVDADCNEPPAPPSDCLGAFEICNSQQFTGNPSGVGGVLDLNSSNDGCLAGEHQGLWFQFTVSTSGTLAFTVDPTSPQYTDYDLAVWGPYSGAITCPPSSPPYRCTWAAGGSLTGLNFTSLDASEGAGGDSWIRWMDVLVGQSYLLYVDNWSQNGISFDFTWNPANTASVDCVVLPLEFLGFEAFARDQVVDLEWLTAAEINTSHFEVERSMDGINFHRIGTVQAGGSNQLTTDYRFTDLRPGNGTNYYRLKQVDLNGEFKYSDIATAYFRGVGLIVFPNPAEGTITALLNGPHEGTIMWRIMDATGRSVLNGTVASTTEDQQVDFSLKGLEVGSYMLELTDGSNNMIGLSRFVKQ